MLKIILRTIGLSLLLSGVFLILGDDINGTALAMLTGVLLISLSIILELLEAAQETTKCVTCGDPRSMDSFRFCEQHEIDYRYQLENTKRGLKGCRQKTK